VRRHNDFALARGLAPVDDEASCVREVLAAVAGYGPLQPYLGRPDGRGAVDQRARPHLHRPAPASQSGFRSR
jgi:hypothetical protein